MDDSSYNPYLGVYKRALELYDNEEYQEAFIKFFSVVENDNSNYRACYYLGNCYFFGYGTDIDYYKAFNNYLSAAKNNYDKALFMVGLCYEFGHGVAKEETQAVSWYMEGTKKDQVDSQYRLGLCYMQGKGIEQSYPLAVTWLLRAAQKGNIDAMKQAAICYENLNQPTASATLFLAAADNNDGYSCYKIAYFYEKGYGCPISFELALFYYKKAGELNEIPAILRLGQIYKNGINVEPSIKEAIYWWLKAQDTSQEAELELSKCYLNGNGVAKDNNIGIKWLTKAAENGNIEAMNELAEYCLNPLPGRKKDESLAKSWWSKAAVLGDNVAMYKLGLCYEDAIGSITPNYQEAYKWYRLASMNGNEDASIACKRFKKSIFGKIKIKKK